MEYKLIKCYPGYDLLGTIVSSENKNFEWQGTFYYDKYPEHWERVIKKNYEILKLSLQRSIKPDIIDVSDSGIEYILSLLKCNGNKIHSIKRKSDNVIFTIGDKINRGSYKDIDVIRGFNLVDDLCLAFISDEIDKGYKDGKGVNISVIEHTKNVLFTTEDGVDIYKGKYYIVKDKQDLDDKPFICYKVSITDDNRNLELNDKNVHRFSTKEKAEEYVLMNKPCLAINDISTMMNNHRGNHSFNNSIMNNLLKNLVKSKL